MKIVWIIIKRISDVSLRVLSGLSVHWSAMVNHCDMVSSLFNLQELSADMFIFSFLQAILNIQIV